MPKLDLKSPEEIEIMKEGGAKLGLIRDELISMVTAGVSSWDIEEKANTLIDQSGGQASFKMVPGYSWATCVNINSGVVHGIPKKTTIFQNGDVVSIDVGLFYKGFHTDTSASVVVGGDKNKQQFLNLGRLAVDMAIQEVKPGNRIYDISSRLQAIIEEGGANVIKVLTGHGIGRHLHEDPYIPCFVKKGESARLKSPEIVPGMTLAIEIMYTQGSGEVETIKDGWTIVTVDGKISALFEETVAVDTNGSFVLTKGGLNG